MAKEKTKQQPLIYIGILFTFLLNYPILSAYNRSEVVGGIPILYLAMFGLWLLLIVLLAFIPKK
ncbi:MAG TPA: hypothetical protein PKH93_12030 [Chitinophagales bacterium]|nr:hypothetical protein [Chitinophagales bacterium]HNL08293.1 hypothetical protein [Chitinophagales bacterium]